MDGTLGSQTARLLDGTGVEITSREELAETVRRGARPAGPSRVHAIGDRANRDALDAFEETRDEWAPRGLRPRIEHAQLLDSADIPRFAALGVAASVQFSHAPPTAIWRSASGRARSTAPTPSARCSNRARSSRTARTRRSRSSTRWPASAQACCARSTTAPRGGPSRPSPSSRRSWRRASTPAWLAGDERRRGKLLPGYLADLVVLDRDPLEDLAGRARSWRRWPAVAGCTTRRHGIGTADRLLIRGSLHLSLTQGTVPEHASAGSQHALRSKRRPRRPVEHSARASVDALAACTRRAHARSASARCSR